MSTDADTSPAAPATLAGGIWAPAYRALTVGLVLAVTIVAFEALAVATILPVVGRELGGIRLYGWVFSAFLLASLAGIVLAGTLADRVPLGRPMLAGLALFALGLVIGGTAPSMIVLVAGRAVQGLGAGVVPTPPRYLSARPGLAATIFSRSLLTCCFFAGDAYVPYAVVTVRHAPTSLTALALTAATLTWTAGSSRTPE